MDRLVHPLPEVTIPFSLRFLLPVSLSLSVPGTAPLPKVSPIRFEDLVRFSDVIAVGTVERVETVDWKAWSLREFAGGLVHPPLPPKVPFAEVAVSRVLKGDPEMHQLVFLASGTWTCDITSAEVGERALLFLAGAERDELFDDQLRRDISARFPGTPVMRVLWSGRGQMPLRMLPGGEYATYWAGEVILPEDFPSEEGPEPEYGFIRSAPLAAFAREIEACVSVQKESWLTASVTDVLDGSSAWDLELTWDRQARLTIHDPSGEQVRHFLLDSSEAVRVAHDLERARYHGCPEVLGKGRPRRGVRLLEILDPKGPMSIRTLTLDADCMRGPAGESARLVLETWKTLRGSFDESSCADHRQVDEPWLER